MKPPRRRGMPRSFEVQAAGTAVAAALALLGLSEEIRGQRLLTEWLDLVGPKLAQRTRPDAIRERTLWVEVATSAWLHELNLLKPQLLANLLQRLGEPRLFDDIRFRLAGRQRRDPVTTPRARPRPAGQRMPVMPATGAARERIVKEVSAVDDAELRELIARVRITHDR